MLLQPSNRNLVLSVVVPVVGGYMSTLVSDKHATQTWYKDIKKPSITPPGFVFPIVWTTLYSTMGYAFYRVMTNAGSAGPLTLTSIAQAQPSSAAFWFATQLALNYAWTPLFFGKREFLAATVDCVLLLGSLVPTIISFSRIDQLAGKLLIPYVAWVSLATYLSGWVAKNNRNVKFVKKYNKALKRDEWHVLKK